MNTRRRAFLRGLGGIAVGLPFLEIMTPRTANAAPAPLRYVVAFAGSSLGMDSTNNVTPDNEGSLMANLTRGLSPLADVGVVDACTYVSGMTIPWGPDGSIPAGGRAIGFHAHTPCPLLTGMRSASDDDERLTGPTSDWIAAQTLAGPTLATRPVLTYRVQPAYYRGSNGTGGTRGLMSARMNGGNVEQVPPTFSPQIAFQDMFTGFIPPDPEEAAAAQALLARRQSIIDLVKGDAEKLIQKLGRGDKERMERHFDELRALELKLEAVNLPSGSSCQMLPDPGADPAIGGAVENGDTAGYSGNGAWSDEELRAEILVDLIHMAFTCDLSRVSALMFTYAQCFMNTNPLYGYPSDLHELSHFAAGGGENGANAVADGVGWHVKHWARLMQKLRDTTDVDGGTILDNTALLLLFEGGIGFDPEQNNQGSPHSSENMGMLVGGFGGGLKHNGGQHLIRQDEHPVRVINTVLNAIGVPGNLGEISGTISGIT
ncbi:MAG: DUF1552 domain-containing protein [Myxococcales bacterium]|nr:DUF1552 domain-containing protein [Myxococcales bacterium]